MLTWIALELGRLRRRVLWLLAFGAVFLAAAATGRLVAGHDGHVEFDALMQLGGYPLVSVLLLTGWLVGRFPLLAVLVLMAGVYSEPRQSGLARLVEVRARSPLLLLALRITLALVLALLISLLVLVSFDVLMLGRPPGGQLFPLALANVLIYGALTALLSTVVRADAWAAAFLMILAVTWHALLRSGLLAASAPGIREAVTVLLPPQGAVLQLENAFAGDLAVPVPALLFAGAYAALALLLAGVVASRREL
jgi:hypothetical protein